ncbi:MAG TPA: hypothetical protein VEA19_07325 [Actinomycetota bacterium]|nr:hypothetical protein [Actinomycetota bacterium]
MTTVDASYLVAAFSFPGGEEEELYRSALEGRGRIVTSLSDLAGFARGLSALGWDQELVRAAVLHAARACTVEKR